MNTWKNIGIFAVSAISLGLFACGGSDGAAGAKGDPGAAGDKGDPGEGVTASAGLIVPNVGLLDRELDVTITGDAIDFTKAAPALDFGPGVTVSNIQVLSSTTLYAHLAVDAAAATGVRDVKITEGSDSLTAKGGFKVAAPMILSANPALEQGQIGDVVADNLDLSHAFDPNAFVFAIDGELSLSAFFAPDVSATHADLTYLIDPNAPATLPVAAANLDFTGAPLVSYEGEPAIPVAAHAPIAVTAGTPLTNQVIGASGKNAIFKYSAAATSIMEINVIPTGSAANPAWFVYGDSGTAKDLEDNTILSFQYAGGTIIYPSLANKSGYITVLDAAGTDPAVNGFTVSAVAHTGTLYAELATAHETLAHATTNAVVTALPAAATNNGVVVTGSLGSGTEEDWYAVNLTSGDHLEVVFTPDFNGGFDVTDGSETSLIGGVMGKDPADGTNAPLAMATANTTALFYIHVISDGTDKGNYTFSLRKRP